MSTLRRGTQEAPARKDSAPGQPHDDLAEIFEALGLTAYEARLLVAVIRVGEGTAAQLAALSVITRPNVYQRLQALEARGLVEARRGSVTVWVSPGGAHILERLKADHKEQLRQAATVVEERCEQAQQVLETLGAEPSAHLPHIKLLGSELQSAVLFERLVAETNHELLVANRGPYPGILELHPVVVEALGRGVKARALYLRSEMDEDEEMSIRDLAHEYQRVGVEGRVVDRLDFGIALFDRRVVLASLPDDRGPEPFPTNFVADHAGFAAWCAATFDQAWAGGQSLADASGEPSLRAGPAMASPEKLSR